MASDFEHWADEISDSPTDHLFEDDGYKRTLYSSCGDVVKTPLSPGDTERFATVAGYCIICTSRD